MSLASSLMDVLGRIAKDVLRQQIDQRTRPTRRSRRPSSGSRGRSSQTPRRSPSLGREYPGDYAGRPSMSYDPHPGELPDPGEVVWTWVPFEEDHSQGKDRPVLLIGRDGDWLLGLPLTSKDHDRDAEQEARAGRHWMDIGRGPWDRQGRPSEVRLDRIIRVNPQEVRRTSSAVSQEVFSRVADGVRSHR